MFKIKIYLSSILCYAFVLLYATFLIFFMLGFFKYEPIAILSNSMNPTFSRGDVAIFKKVDKLSIQKITKNSILIYQINNKYIAHRVVDILYENDNIYYITKGDANNTTDTYKVPINDVKGIYLFHIKFIGYPTIWLHEWLHKDT